MLRSEQYPSRESDAGLYYECGFQQELRAYRAFRRAKYQDVPYLYGSTTKLTVHPIKNSLYDLDWHELNGHQNAIMLEYLEGEMLSDLNITREAASQALSALKEIHQLRIMHGDIYDFGALCLRNLMLINDGTVRWIDFEHCVTSAREEDLEEEMAVAQEVLGPTGRIWTIICTESTHV